MIMDISALIRQWFETLGPEDWAQLALSWGFKLISAIVLIWVGIRAAKFVGKMFYRAMQKASVEPTVAQFMSRVVYFVLLILITVVILQLFGVPATSLLALLGAAGLAIGLAMKDSLSNIASGVMLVGLRSFKVGDMVTIADKTGKVVSISIFQTVLRGGNNQTFIIPNNLVTSSPIINLTPDLTRRIELTIGIGYKDDIDLARAQALNIIKNDRRVLNEPPADVLVYSLGDSAVNLGIRCHVLNDDWFLCSAELLENIKKAFDRAGISIPFPQREVHVHHHDANTVSNLIK